MKDKSAAVPWSVRPICFRHLKYRELPMEQIEAELERVRSLGGNPKHVFLGDGNAFGLGTKRLLEITDLIHRYFPDCQAINMDGTITNIQAKSQEELRALREAGIRHLYLGIESGLDDVLRYMGKDHNLDQAYRQIPATELENLQEERLLLELLNTDGPLTYDGFHDRIEFRVRGTLPDDKMKMLDRLDLAIEGYREHEPVIAAADDSPGAYSI